MNYLIKRKKGQLIVFGVLIFPVIFLCLAMVINVGMVVHDKINLQNSVDLAAIYAAQKQAEVMDAMAHINYQMRQSYKLLAWRYMVLGNSGAFVEPTIRRLTETRILIGGSSKSVMNILHKPQPQSRQLCPNAGPGCLHTACNTPTKQQDCRYAVCTVHPLFFSEYSSDDSHVCQNYGTVAASSTPLPPKTPSAGIFDTVSTILGNRIVQRHREGLAGNCADVGFQNWLIATSMYFAFINDQKKRKIFVEETLFPLLKNAKDIEGEDIREGVFKTIQKNLTYVNYKNFNPARDPSQLQFNVMKKSVSPSSLPEPLNVPDTFEQFFEWDVIRPVPYYVQNIRPHPGRQTSINSLDSFCETRVQSILQCNPADAGRNPSYTAELPVESEAMRKIAGHDPGLGIPLCQLLEEVSRNDWKNIVSGFYKINNADNYADNYADNLGVKVEVTIPYEGQLFFPFFRPIQLKANAYAKPFGASFGSSRMDNNIPKSGAVGQPINYSRRLNDLWGLTDERVQWAWNMLFTNGTLSGSGMHTTSQSHGRTFNNYSDLLENLKDYKDPMFLHYNFVSTSTIGTGTGTRQVHNVLISNRDIFTKRMRIYEEIAIAPDQFDLAHYTILPNYMLTLYPKLKSHSNDPNYYVPADLGHFRNVNPVTDISHPLIYINNPPRSLDPPFRLNYIERQIHYVNNLRFLRIGGINSIYSIFNESPLGYKAQGIDKVLTSWAPSGADSFASSQAMYNSSLLSGTCAGSDADVKLTFSGADPFLASGEERKVIPSHCLKGGRTGFSVKLISPEAL